MNDPKYHVIRYTIGYQPAESTQYIREWVTAYFDLYVSERFFLYAPSSGFEEIQMPAHGENVSKWITKGAVVAASQDLRHALAFYTGK
jgi:hypothetical protein